MKRSKLPALLAVCLLLLGSFGGTFALAAGTTAVPAAQTAAAEETASPEEAAPKRSLGKQLLILLAFGAGVGLLAALYGVINMRYNQEKMDDMSEAARDRIRKMREKK